MKKIIFSSVCAVALLGTSVYAEEASASLTPNWDKLVTEWGDKITPKQAEYDKIVTTQLIQAVQTARSTLEAKQLATQAAKQELDRKIAEIGNKGDKLKEDSSGSLNAKLSDAGSKLLGGAVANAPTSEDKATTLNELLKYFETNKEAQDSDGKKAEAIKVVIAKVDNGEKVTLSSDLSGITTAGITTADAYNTAVTNLTDAITALGKPANGDEPATNLYKALEDAQKGEATAQDELNEANKSLLAAESKPEAVALKAELDKLKAEKEAYEKIVESNKIIEAGTKQAETALQTAQEKYDGEIAGLKEKAATAKKNYDDQVLKVETAKTTLTGKANILIGADNPTAPEKAADAKTLNELLAFYKKDASTNASKIAEVQQAITDAKDGKEVTLTTTGTEASGVLLTEYSGAQSSYTTEQGKVDGLKTALEQANTAVENSENALTQAKNDLKKAQDKVAKAQADLQNALVSSPEGKEVASKVQDSLGNLQAGAAADKLVALLAKNGADVSKITDATVKAQIQQAANEVAQEVINSKKESISQQALGTLNVQINNMNKRLGEVRGMGGDIGVWARAYGGRYSTDTNHFNYYSTQVGADKLNSLGNGDLIVGGLFGFDKVNADAKTKAISLGAYASYIDNSGYFVDTVLKYARASHKQDGWDYKKQNIFLASIEGGYRFNVSDNGYIEPSLELITGHVGKYKATTGNTEISVDSFMPLIFKPQVFFGANINDFTFRAGFGGVINAKRNNANIRINNIVSGLDASSSTKLDRNNHGFASIGGSYKFTDNLRLNLGVERSFGGKLTQDYEVNATIRYTF